MPTALHEQYNELWLSGDEAPDLFGFLEQHNSVPSDVLVEVILVDQRHRWKTEHPLKVEDYLARLPHLDSDDDLKLQLAAGEFQARIDGDTLPDIGEFTARFGEISGALRRKLAELASDQSPDGNDIEDETIEVEKLEVEKRTFSLGSPDRQGQLGRYRLIRILGEGAFGRVYLAHDDELRRQVAIKVPTAERFEGPEDAEAYLSEARTVASLDHPNIVPVYDMGRTDDGSVFVVSKFIEGVTLAEQIRQDRPAFDAAATLLATIARALQHAHDRHLIHRDVKPDNILLEDRSGTAYIADFGLAIREEDYLSAGAVAGTPAYMSPEQARGEGHRLDGRSDVFSLGVVFYELLTGKRPFSGSTVNEVLHQVVSVDPPAPREIDDAVPAELERICLKAICKKASDRYASAGALADDLAIWDQSELPSDKQRPIVPRGLRSFGPEDADYFLDLLPGTRTRDGLPESIAFWKERIEETDPDKTFTVGLLYGPSGCGKSSLMKAGLLPRLSKDVVAVYVEATPDETETRILRGLRKALPQLPSDAGIVEIFTLLRRTQAAKVVVVLDQFEQWLHAHRGEHDAPLISALRQCDGGALQCVVMVRDDFAMPAARFMDSLDVPIVQGKNFATVDLFDRDHAEHVLIRFGQAFGKLPSPPAKLAGPQQEFVAAVASGLAEDGKVVSVRLALFAEMVKNKPWVPATLEDVGGTEGIGVNFLEETFASRSANPKHRLHSQAARHVLAALLPAVGSDIKGHMRSHAELLEASGYEHRPSDFNDLLRTLDGELRLITPTDPEGIETDSGRDPDSKYYQLTHDYLVPSLRKWLTRKQQETRAGRAELRLAERAALWHAKPQNRHLPSLLEWISIRGLTDSKRWTGPQRTMMRKAGRVHGTRAALALAGLVAVLFAGIAVRNTIEKNRLELIAQKQEERNDAEATRLVEGLLQADTSQVETIMGDLANYRQWARDDLQRAYAASPEDSNARLHAALAMLPNDPSVLPFLKDRLLTVSPTQFSHVLHLLETHKAELTADYWKIATDTGQDPARRFQAACALAGFDPENEHWREGAFTEFVAGHLCGVLPSELAPWRNALRGVKERLIDPLSRIFRDDSTRQQVRSFATDTLVDYAKDDPETLAGLVVDADAEAFEVLLPALARHRQAAITQMKAVLDRRLRPDWHDGPLDASWTNPDTDAKAAIEAAHGIVGERFAFCQDLPWDKFSGLAETLSKSGYRPARVRPYWSGRAKADRGAKDTVGDGEAPTADSVAQTPPTLLVAAIWTRDGKRWELQTGLTRDDLPDPNKPATRHGLVPVDLAVFPPSPPSTRNPPRFTILWGEPASADEKRRLIVDLTREQIAAQEKETTTGFYTSHLAKQGFASQSVIAVWTDENGVRRYGGIWSTRGAPSEINPAYPGFELVDQPQWDVAAAAAASDKLPDPLDVYRRLMAQIKALPPDRLDAPPVRLARARAQFHLGQFAAALADLDFLVEKQQPVPAEVLHLRAWTLARMKKTDKAREALAKFLERDEASNQAYVQIVTLAWLEEHDKATAKLDEFVSAAGRDSGKLYDAACAAALAASPYFETDATRAKKYAERALQLLESAVTHGSSDAEHMGSDVDLAGLHEEPRFAALLRQLQPPANYAAVWHADVTVESRTVAVRHSGDGWRVVSRGMDEERSSSLQSLLDTGWRPVAIVVTPPPPSPRHPQPPTTLILHRPLIPDDAKEQLARQQATAAAALLRLDAAEPVWHLFQHQSDPRLRSYLLHRLVPYGAAPATIIERLKSEKEVSRRRTLILAIGEFARANLLSTEQTASATDVLARWYADDVDAGVHGACEWSLRQLGADDAITKVQQAYATGKVVGARQWYLTKTGRQTFVLVDAQGEFLMGSPVSEAERYNGPTGKTELRHRRRIGRRFAIGAHEVTVAQFQQFRENHPFDRTKAREPDAPANMITWYDAAAYCNWLSAREGIPREQWCYDPDQKFEQGMTLVPDYLQRTGYRLPTEAEWEYACRAGSTTARYFGETETLLGQYAWYTKNSGDRWFLPVGSLKPNDYGLFDMQGNIVEWCQDVPFYYNKKAGWMGDMERPGRVGNSLRRVLRGGSFVNVAAKLRSAKRILLYRPAYRLYSHGFRVARTYR